MLKTPDLTMPYTYYSYTIHVHDIDHASALKEFTQFITTSTQRSTDYSIEQPPSEVQEGHVKISADYPWRQLSQLKRENI